MTRWKRLDGTQTYWLYGPCYRTAYIASANGVFFGKGAQPKQFKTLAAAKREGKLRLIERVIEARNKAHSDAMECDEWLRVNR